MSDGSAIEWTDATWNPVRGCVKISPGCKHCYAETFAERWRGIPGHPYEHGFDVRLVPEKLLEPFAWSRSRRVFVNSMSDLFQDAVSIAFIRTTLSVMASADWHIYQVLTKRGERMRDVLSRLPASLVHQRHIWMGVSVEDRKYGLPRLQQLRDTPAAMRFLSIEPLLEDLGSLDLRHIDWVIVGGESGPGARPMKEEWVWAIYHQCAEAGIPFFFKQWGGVQKGKTGRLLGERTFDAFPDVKARPAPGLVERRQKVEHLRHTLGFSKDPDEVLRRIQHIMCLSSAAPRSEHRHCNRPGLQTHP